MPSFRLLDIARAILFVGALSLTRAERASAQSDLPDITPPVATRPTPATSKATPLEPAVRIGQELLATGILPRLRYVDAFAANPIGGLKQGADNSGAVIFGSDFDLQRLVGRNGAQFHVSFAQFFGHELSTDNIGSRTKVQSFYYPYKQFELTELTYEQSILDDRVDIVVGRSNATGEFARSTYGCRFENVADCPFELTQLVGGFPGFPYVNWGGRIRIAPAPDFYVKAGAYEINSRRNRTTGFDWGINNATGYVVPFEVGYGTSYATDQHPRHYKLGAWYNSAPHSDPYLNTKGRSRAQFGGTALLHSGGHGGTFAVGDQVVWRPDHTTARGIAAFASVAAPFTSDELFAMQAVAGALWTGPFASRPFDQLGIFGSYIRLSNKETGYLNGLLAKAHSNTFISRHGFLFELNYGFEIAPGITLQPTLQYLVNPDNIARPAAKMAPRDAVVIGLKLSVDANQLSGLPQALLGFRRPGT